ncbi:Telomerase Protein Component 1 [Manis pentadactyla]|nr:Telomerase Protein Component 1 [Manis pentadactyla]
MGSHRAKVADLGGHRFQANWTLESQALPGPWPANRCYGKSKETLCSLLAGFVQENEEKQKTKQVKFIFADFQIKNVL